MRFFIILLWEWKVKTLRNNTATFICSHYCLSFEIINWLFYHLFFRWILCKKQSLTTHLECPFPRRRNKLFLVMSVSFALTQMWVLPFHCSLHSVKVKIWLFWIYIFLHIYILPSSHSCWWPTYFSVPIFKRFGFSTRNLSNRVASIETQGFLSVISLTYTILYLIPPMIFTFEKYLNSRQYFLKFKMQCKHEKN